MPPHDGAPLPESSPEARALYDEAAALSAARKHRQAIAVWRACLKADPGLALARLGLCENLLVSGDRESAKTEAAPLETLSPRDEQTWRRAFALFQSLDDQTRAEVVTRRFIAEVGGTAEARIELVAMQPVPEHLSRDRIEADLADAVRHAEEEPLFWRRVAKQQRRLGHHDDALHAIERALSIKPDDFEARCDRVEILVRQGKEKLARKHLAEVIPFVPETVQGFLQIAEIATEARDAAIARDAIDRALAVIKPDLHGPRFRLIQVMLANGDQRADDIIRHLTAACEDPKVLRRLFNQCYEKDYKELALAIGEKLQRIAPANYEVATRLDGLRFVASRQKPAGVRAERFAPRRGQSLLRKLFGGGEEP